MSEKKPRLFYYDDGVCSWLPCPDRVEDLVDVDILGNGETMEVQVKRYDMTDAEFAALPEV